MKRKRFWLNISLLGIFGCLFAAMACSDDKSVPELVIENETLRVSGQGEEAALTYQTLSWPRGAELSVSSDQEWLHDFDTSTPGEVRFTVDPAPYAETKGRQATLTITSPTVATLHTTVEVKQEFNSSFAYFQLDRVEDDLVAFHLFMNPDVYNNFTKILHYCFTREEADAIQTGEQMLEAFDQKMADMANGSSYYWMWRVGYMYSRSLTDMFCDLQPDTEYCLMAVGLRSDGIYDYEPATPVLRTYFTTDPAREHPVASARLNAQIVNGIVHVDLQTDCESPYTIIAVAGKSNYESNSKLYTSNIKSFASKAILRGYLIHPEENVYVSAGVNTIYFGEGTHYFYNATADRELLVVAQAYDERLRPLTDLLTFEGNTFDIPSDCCATSVEMLELEPWYARFRAQSTDPTMELYYGVYPKEVVDSLVSIDRLSSWAHHDLYRRNGVHEFGFNDDLSLSIVPEPGKAYTAFAYSAGARKPTSPLARIDFTLPAEQPSSVKADVQEVKFFSIEELVKHYDLPMLEGSSQKYLVISTLRTSDDVEHIDDWFMSDSRLNSILEQHGLTDTRALLITLARMVRTYDDLYRYWLYDEDGVQDFYFIPYEKGTHQVGEMTKIPVNLTPEGCASVEEFKEHYSQFQLKEKAVTLRSLEQTRFLVK